MVVSLSHLFCIKVLEKNEDKLRFPFFFSFQWMSLIDLLSTLNPFHALIHDKAKQEIKIPLKIHFSPENT